MYKRRRIIFVSALYSGKIVKKYYNFDVTSIDAILTDEEYDKLLNSVYHRERLPGSACNIIRFAFEYSQSKFNELEKFRQSYNKHTLKSFITTIEKSRVHIESDIKDSMIEYTIQDISLSDGIFEVEKSLCMNFVSNCGVIYGYDNKLKLFIDKKKTSDKQIEEMLFIYRSYAFEYFYAGYVESLCSDLESIKKDIQKTENKLDRLRYTKAELEQKINSAEKVEENNVRFFFY